ncbi:sensor histidine kinase [Sulfurimonas sp.]
MSYKLEKYFTSGWDFSEENYEMKNKFQMMNIGILLSSVGVLYGVVLNYVLDHDSLALVEFSLFLLNVVLVILLHKDKKFLLLVAHIETAFMSIFMLYLIYTSDPMALKHVWLFTYPIVILYFKNEKHALYWILFMISMVIISPYQPFIKPEYTGLQIATLVIVFSISTIIVYFYHLKMQEARKLIFSQSRMLSTKVEELVAKDKILTVQSKQAVMGEMISMIAHQWRQPLSSITLNISKYHVKKMLGQKMPEDEVDKILDNISDTVVYLSDTINDFQTYFHSNKKSAYVDIRELIIKTINFTKPRVKGSAIKIEFDMYREFFIDTYSNELIQVLLNIVNNAIDEFIENRVEDPKIEIFLTENINDMTIEIHDNAGGIKVENINSIFEPYFSTKGKNGTGLGLYMSQMIMQKQFNTSIEVVSEHHETVFKVIVPKELS